MPSDERYTSEATHWLAGAVGDSACAADTAQGVGGCTEGAVWGAVNTDMGA